MYNQEHNDLNIIPKVWNYEPYDKTFVWQRNMVDMSRNTSLGGLEETNKFIIWCNENKCILGKITVTCPDDKTAVLFALTWY